MESIESLLDKYWNGETTLEEEKLIRAHFARLDDVKVKNPVDGSSETQQEVLQAYFGEINRRKQMYYEGKKPGFSISFRRQWLSLAATVIIGIAAAVVSVQQNQQKDPFLVEDPEKAMEIVKTTFAMISDNLNEGRKYTSKIDKINRTKQIFKAKQQDSN